MGLAEVIHRMVTNEAFVVQLQEELDQALGAAGLSLSTDEKEALQAILLGNQTWQNLCTASFAEPEQFPWAPLLSLSPEIPCTLPPTVS